MDLALRAQRWTAGFGIALFLGWAALAGEVVVGLWAATWLAGVTCCGTGAVVNEMEKRGNGGRRPDPPRTNAREVLASGFGYLAIGMLAGAFHPVITMVGLVVALVDFAAGHPIAGRLLGRPDAPATPAE
ncbi:MAG: hypothetical protein AAF962_03535 [Actinomycetota bacterium]